MNSQQLNLQDEVRIKMPYHPLPLLYERILYLHYEWHIVN
jgi:hypothetical protein